MVISNRAIVERESGEGMLVKGATEGRIGIVSAAA